ncbi:hypothetical protein JTE90_022831 [Oedothorax gibbosus]|uniref:Cuticle protein 16.8 n=1 Tax=Oedothorax gibbosus TaxID=931172 RepID=A0AAV6V5U0_9ARAC|nr:hypothetical protein JTE90_022831 [Oedothorax gibbosus]
MKVLILLCLVAAAVAAPAEEVKYAPIPYSFNYNAETEDGGSSARQEAGDGAGKVQGSYTVTDLEGHSRTVEYVADELGFRANVRSNEPGTANINPASITVESSADDGGIAEVYSAAVAAAAATYSASASVGPKPAAAARPAQSRPAARTGTRYVLVSNSS